MEKVWKNKALEVVSIIITQNHHEAEALELLLKNRVMMLQVVKRRFQSGNFKACNLGKLSGRLINQMMEAVLQISTHHIKIVSR